MQALVGLAVQPLIAACRQAWLVRSQLSAVHESLSLQAASALQQPATAACWHTRAAVSQRSLLQGAPSSQACRNFCYVPNGGT